MKPNPWPIVATLIALTFLFAFWQWTQNGRYVYHGSYVIDSRTGEVTKVTVR